MAEDFKIPALNKNVAGARTPGQDDVAGVESPVQNIDDANRSRQVINQDTKQESQFDEFKTQMSPEDRAKRKSMLIQAFDRGIVHDRLAVKLPPHIHGEWVRNDPMEVDRLKTIGFEVDYEYATRRGINNDGTGAAVVADVIFMICPKEVKELIDEVRMDKFQAINGKPGDRKAKTKEEKEFEMNTARDSGGIIPTMTESETTTRFSKADVEAALDKVDRQTMIQTVPST